jgi:hypothetical protein
MARHFCLFKDCGATPAPNATALCAEHLSALEGTLPVRDWSIAPEKRLIRLHKRVVSEGCQQQWRAIGAFLSDVGAPPLVMATLVKLDKTAPWGADNFTWGAPDGRLSPCEVAGCGRVAFALGLCRRHYTAARKAGELERCQDSKVRGHPNYDRWRGILRSRQPVADRWRSLLAFHEDVGLPPARGAKLFRIDPTKPYGPGNFRWGKAPPETKAQTERDRAERRKLQSNGAMQLSDWLRKKVA